MITIDWLKENDSCYFWKKEEPCDMEGCSVCEQAKEREAREAAALAWLGEGKTLRQIAENESISEADRLWVLRRALLDNPWTIEEALSLLGEDADR